MEEIPLRTKQTHVEVKFHVPTRFRGRSVEDGLPVTKPLYNLEELLAWKVDGSHDKGQSFSIASVAYHGKYIPDGEPKTMVCHDMAGGYLDDRFVQGTFCGDDEWYYMAYWDVVDTFVYFSHHYVTIPPVGWINCAHTNGVSVLGTFITEGDTGFDRCEAMFSNDSVWKLVADALVKIAKYYKFEGWLLNIENNIRPQNMGRLKEFVKYLTEEMHHAVAGSQVIWYDSVTVDGVLAWQDELNAENQLFFDRCDGILLNYTWNEVELQKSAELAMVTSRVTDVYVGVDVFGRGCYGGGGMNSCAAIEVSRKYSLSAAIFAPAWVKEVLGSENFETNQAEFWKALAPYCKRHAVNVPRTHFYTDFHPGIEVRKDSRFLHLSRQSLLPHMTAGVLQPVPVASQTNGVVLSACREQLFFKAKMRAKPYEGGDFQIYVLVKDPGETSVKITAKCEEYEAESDRTEQFLLVNPCSVEDFLCTTSNERVEILEFAVQAFPKLGPGGGGKEEWVDVVTEGNDIDIRLDDVTWEKSGDINYLLFSSTVCFEGIDESLPVAVSFSLDEKKFEQLGIAYCGKYRIHNLRVPNPIRRGLYWIFVIKAEQRHPVPEFLSSGRLDFLNCKCGELVVIYGETPPEMAFYSSAWSEDRGFQ